MSEDAQRVSVTHAGQLLGVSGGDIHRATRAKRVTMAQVQAWQAQPPGWLVSAQARKRRAAAQRKRRAEERRLCPPTEAQRLRLPYRRVVKAMRAAGDAQPLNKHVVQGWLSGGEEMPAWLSELLAAAAAEAAERQALAQAETLEAEHRRLLAEERVQAKLLAGHARFRGVEFEIVEEWAFDAAKELVRKDGEVTEVEAAVLAVVGVDAGIHTTWPIHRGGCDAMAGDSCDARIAELAAQHFEEQEAARHERQERASRDAAAIASGAFALGQSVLAFYGTRAAMVTQVNRVTVKVKHVGGQADRYQLVEKTYSPAYLRPLPGQRVAAADAIAIGQPMQFLDWGHRRRTGGIVAVDGPLLQVQYRLASGRSRTAWIDVLRLEDKGSQRWH